MGHGEEAPMVRSHELEKEKKHDRYHKLTEIGTIAAEIVAVHERHQARKHPEDAAKHKRRGQVADAIAIGANILSVKENYGKK
eukprot:c21863_g1_i1 orf=490-738(-)